MSTVIEIQEAIAKLPELEQRALARWFAEMRADIWDKQIEEDIHAGRLDHLAEEALKEFADGRTTAFPPNEKPGQR